MNKGVNECVPKGVLIIVEQAGMTKPKDRKDSSGPVEGVLVSGQFGSPVTFLGYPQNLKAQTYHIETLTLRSLSVDGHVSQSPASRGNTPVQMNPAD
jgi:hypothetical protein